LPIPKANPRIHDFVPLKGNSYEQCEWQETMVKAKAVSMALGIKISQLEKL
jgi:hypothetical protein